MLARLGNVLYWYGIIVAVLIIVGAVIWNGVTYYERQGVEERLAASTEDFFGRTEDQRRAINQARERLLDKATENQRTSLILGGVAVLFGLGAYGVGWAARYVLRGPS